MRTVVVVVVVAFSFVHVCESVRTNGERERKKERARRGSVSVSLPNAVPRAKLARRALVREREREKERKRDRASVHLISNDYLVVVLVADDRSQSRDVAQKSQDDEAETLTLPRRRPHRPPPRCFGAGLLLHKRERERERERDEEKFCVVEITQLLLDLSLSY